MKTLQKRLERLERQRAAGETETIMLRIEYEPSKDGTIEERYDTPKIITLEIPRRR